MAGWLPGTVFAALFLAYPFLLRGGEGGTAGAAPFVIAPVLIWRAGRARGAMRWLLAGLGSALAAGAWWLGPEVSRWVPAVAFLFVAWGFGRTLIHPPPLIERMVRLQYRDIPDYLLAYLRRLTWLWTVFFLLLACISAVLGLWGTETDWFWFHAVGIYGAMTVLLMGEFLYRRRRFSELGEMPLPHETFLAIAREGRRLWEE